MLVRREAGKLAVVAQPAGGRGVAAGTEAVVAVELLYPACALRFETVDDAADSLDVGAQIDRIDGPQILLGERGQALLETIKHLFDSDSAFVARPSPFTTYF